MALKFYIGITGIKKKSNVQLIARRVPKEGIIDFLKKYPKMRVYMNKFVNKTGKGLLKDYSAFIDWKNKGANEALLGGRVDEWNYKGTDVRYFKYEWPENADGFAFIFQYLWLQKNGGYS